MFDLASLYEWLQAQSHLVLPAVALTAFIESFAIAGIVVPGVAILFSIAALASLSGIPLFDVLLAAFIGAVAGDLISFFIGRAFHASIPNKWPFSRYPEALAKGEQFFNKYGTLSVVIGRFVGPLRPVLPITAGILKMPTSKFVSINLLSALAWAPAYILPGYLGASLSQSLFSAPLLTQVLIGLGLVSLALPPWLAILRIGGLSLSSKHQRIFWLLYALFALMLTALLVIFGHLDQFDVWVLSHAVDIADQTGRTTLVAITLLGDQILLIAIFLTSIVFFYQIKHPNAAIVLCFAGISAAVVTHLLKYSLAITRPELIVGHFGTYSFPSGHTSGFAILLGTWFIIAMTPSAKRHLLLKTSLLSAIILMASSRVLLGVHWLSDVIAGLLLAAALVISSEWLYSALNKKQGSQDIAPQADSGEAKHRTSDWKTLSLICISLAVVYEGLTFSAALRYYAPW